MELPSVALFCQRRTNGNIPVKVGSLPYVTSSTSSGTDFSLQSRKRRKLCPMRKVFGSESVSADCASLPFTDIFSCRAGKKNCYAFLSEH